MKSLPCSSLLVVLALALTGATSSAQWNGFVNRSTELQTGTFSFTGSNPEAGDNNENYYDGDFGDFDHDGRLDRAIISRYGLLWNTGGGALTPVANTIAGGTYQFGDKDNIGNDAVVWVDFNGDGWEDTVQGGNGEPLTFQINNKGRFTLLPKKSGSAREIRKIDLENDGDVDLLITSTFCFTRSCGLPVDFKVWQNDGNGNFTEVTVAAGLAAYRDERVVDVQVGDLDGDGDFDFTVVNGGRQSVDNDFNQAAGGRAQLMARFNNGNGVFTEERVFFNVPATVANLGDGAGPTGGGESQALGDIDGDGDLDLVFTAPGPLGSHPNIAHALFLNDGAGNFTEVSAARFNAGSYTGMLIGQQLKFADIDHDNDLDIVSYIQSEPSESGNNSQGLNLGILLNNGSGFFTLNTNAAAAFTRPPAGGLFTLDVADITGDGALDLWLGHQDADVVIQANTFAAADGLPADMPRNLQLVSANTGGVTLNWQAPPFASTVRFYRVYRSTAPGLLPMDRRLIHTIAMTPFADDSLIAPIDTNTTTAALNDPSVVLNGALNQIQFTDTNAQAGVTYYYSVVHVGPETKPSQPTPELAAGIVGPTGADGLAPSVDIVSPVFQDWSQYPKIVVHYADDNSGINLASLNVSFNVALADGTPANTDLSGSFHRKDAGAYVYALSSPRALPLNTLVTLTVSVADQAGNTATQQAQFFVSESSPQLPTAVVAPSVTSGAPPLNVSLSGANSADPDGKIVRWEWYFPDGSAQLGKTATKTFTNTGPATVWLVTRDTHGGARSASVQLNVGTNLNQSPVVNAGPNQTLVDTDGNGSETVTLAGSATDTDGTIASYTWREGATVLASTATAQVNFSVGVHNVELVATDNLGASATNQLVVTILPQGSSLILHWPLDETSGSTAADQSGFANHGTVATVTRETGVFGGAFGFHGNINYNVLRNPVSNFPSQEITTTFWITTPDSNEGLVSYATGTGSASDSWAIVNSASLTIFRGAASVNTGVSVNNFQWNHVAVTWRASDGRLQVFVNGASAAYTGTLAPGTAIPGGGALIIGQEQDSVGGGLQRAQSLSGNLDDIRIYNRVLDLNEINSVRTGIPVVNAPIISQQPVSAGIGPGGSVTLNVAATGDNLAYQWQLDGVAIPGATGSSLVLTNGSLQSAGRYAVVVSNSAGSVTSNVATIRYFGDLRMYPGMFLAGETNDQYRIEYAQILGNSTNWITATNLVHPGGVFLYVDPAGAGQSQRFYRAVLISP